MLDFQDIDPVKFRRLCYDDGLLGFVEFELEKVDYDLEASVRVVSSLAGVSREGSERKRLQAIMTFAQDKMSDFNNDADSTRPLETMLAVCGLVGTVAVAVLDSPERLVGLLLLLASFLLLLLNLILHLARSSRRRKTLDVLSLIVTEEAINLCCADN